MSDPIPLGPVKGRFELIESRIDELALKVGGGGGTSGGVTEDWKSGVDRQLAQLHTDLRGLLRVGVLAVVGLAAMVAGLYLYTNQKFESVATRLSAVEVQQAHIIDRLDVLLERTSPKK